jgi:cysteinyl-tRNA synthetase
MPQILAMVQGLIESGYAYEAGGDVYFRVEQDPGYGKLSGRRLDDMQVGARIEIGELKENPMDFALWKAAKPGEPAWESPWGLGRPGWHIECSAMNLNHLGEQIDIHGGGNDLIFPHHENEIAQTESLTGKQFARFWIHNGMLQLSGEKMSKSLGNLVTIDDFLAQHEADVLRLMVLNSSYRGPLSYNEEIVAQTERALERLRSAMRPALSEGGTAGQEVKETLEQQGYMARQCFENAMDDDFNTASALGCLFDLVRVINQGRDAGVGADDLEKTQVILVELAGVLGLRMEPPQKTGGQAAPFIELLIEIRKELRAQKLWALSDLVRNRLHELGVVLEDGKEGTAWRWK